MCEFTTFSANNKDNALKLNRAPLFPHSIVHLFLPSLGRLWRTLLDSWLPIRYAVWTKLDACCEVHSVFLLCYYIAGCRSLYIICNLIGWGRKIPSFAPEKERNKKTSDIPKKNSHVFQKFSTFFRKSPTFFGKNSHVFSEISHVLVCSLRYSWNKIGENVFFSPKFHSLLSLVLWCIGFKSASLWDEGGAIRDITLYPAKDATCASGLSSYFLVGKSVQNGCFRVFLLVFK